MNLKSEARYWAVILIGMTITIASTHTLADFFHVPAPVSWLGGFIWVSGGATYTIAVAFSKRGRSND